MSKDQVDRVPSDCGSGSRSEFVDDVGHSMMVERPDDINQKITEFLAG